MRRFVNPPSTQLLARSRRYGGNTAEPIDESFNKADGSLGPDLTWYREVFLHQFPARVVGQELNLTADDTGSFEELWVPYPNVNGPDARVTHTITSVTRSLATIDDYTVDGGCIFRYTRSGDNYYRGYAIGAGRNNTFIPPANLWHLLIFRVDGPASQILIGSAFTATALTTPGTFDAMIKDSTIMASFTPTAGPKLEAVATDSTYTTGEVAWGGSVVLENPTDSATFTMDNFHATTQFSMPHHGYQARRVLQAVGRSTTW